MLSRLLARLIAPGTLVAIVTVIDLAEERQGGIVFIAGNEPITKDQVRQKMTADRTEQPAYQPEGALLPGRGIERPAAGSPRGRLADRSSTA